MALLLGIDIGTTSIKAVLFDSEAGGAVRTAVRPTPVTHPRSEWSEHDPQALWQAAAECIREAAGGQPVRGLAISSMAETGVLVDAAGLPVGPVIAWYDRRSEQQAAWIETRISTAALYAITGQRASPSFGVTKLMWIRDQMPEAFARGRRWLPVPAYLLWRLTGEQALDYSIAARTLLFDQRARGWSAELLDRFGLSPDLLPPLLPGGSAVGAVHARAAAETGLPVGTVCALGGHDHLCATLAAGGRSAGEITDSTGTANALLLLTDRFHPDPALGGRGYACSAYVLEGLYTLKGGLKAAGSAVDWLARQLSPEGSRPDYAGLEAAARAGAGRRAGPLWLPHLIGSGTPEGDRFSRAALVGAQLEHDRGDLFRGMLESLAFWLRHNMEEMGRLTGLAMQPVTLIGGVTRLELLSQLKADVTNQPVRVPQIPEAAAAGAALLAGLGSGVFHSSDQAADSLKYTSAVLEPDPGRAEWYDALYRRAYLPLYQALRDTNHALEDLQYPNFQSNERF